MHLPSLLVFALSGPGFSTRLVSLPSQSKSIQLRIDSVRPIPVVAISIRCVRISALPCPVSCAQRSAMSYRVASCPIAALPCRSISDRFLSTPILSAAPPLASDPISAMACLLAADLFRGCSARRDSLPCHSAASQCTSIPSHRCFAVSLMVGSNLYYSAASPVCAVLRLAIAYPIYTVHFPCCSSEFNARSSLLVSYRVASPPFRSYSYRRPTIPQPFASSRVHSLPSRFISFQDASMPLLFCSKPFPAVQCLRQSFRVAAMPLPVSSSPSAPFMAIPLLVASVRFLAVSSHIYWM